MMYFTAESASLQDITCHCRRATATILHSAPETKVVEVQSQRLPARLGG